MLLRLPLSRHLLLIHPVPRIPTTLITQDKVYPTSPIRSDSSITNLLLDSPTLFFDTPKDTVCARSVLFIIHGFGNQSSHELNKLLTVPLVTPFASHLPTRSPYSVPVSPPNPDLYIPVLVILSKLISSLF